MPYPSLTFAQLLENATRQELEQFVSLLQGYLSEQHDDTGAHTTITVEEVGSHLVPTTNGTYDLGKQVANADDTARPFLAWRDLFLTRSWYWVGSALSGASIHIASWITTLSSNNITHTAQVATTQTQKVIASDGTTMITIGGATSESSLINATSGVTIPTLAATNVYASSRVVTETIATDSGTNVQQQDVQTIANGATYDFPNGSTPEGILVIASQQDNAAALFLLRGGTGATILISDPVGTEFTATSGTATRTNVFWNAGTGAYRIENNRGGSRTYNLILLGGSGIV